MSDTEQQMAEATANVAEQTKGKKTKAEKPSKAAQDREQLEARRAEKAAEREAEKAAKQAELEAKKAEKAAEREAAKAAKAQEREASKAEKQAERDAKRAERQAAREAAKAAKNFELAPEGTLLGDVQRCDRATQVEAMAKLTRLIPEKDLGQFILDTAGAVADMLGNEHSMESLVSKATTRRVVTKKVEAEVVEPVSA